jgi:hypothetical protein
MCARLGIRQAYSQAYRAQANGRAEVAGKTLYNVLRKLHTDHKVNWVEALPRVLRHHHNYLGDNGVSPYQILFGRNRNEAGLPYTPPGSCPSAQTFFDRIEALDEEIEEYYCKEHEQVQRRVNETRKPRPPFDKGDQVWVLRPKSVKGNKMETWWIGPAKILQRTGNSSYQVEHKSGEVWDVHMDSLKIYVEDDFMGTSVPLFYHQGTTKSTGLSGESRGVIKIFKHRLNKGILEFLVERSGEIEPKWEGVIPLWANFSETTLNYIQ